MVRGLLKAQSAMEYLMTYGWSILIVAVVLGALFNLGVFSNFSVVTACVQSPGFYCSGISYPHATGNIIVSLGQSTGSNWGGWAVGFANSMVTTPASGIPNVPFVTQAGSLANGKGAIGVNLPASAPVSVGAVAYGEIWVCYAVVPATSVTGGVGSCSATGGTVQYAQMATVTARAT